jgi:glutaminyl-peptide cyclotransferase
VRGARNLALVIVLAGLAGCGGGGNADSGSSGRTFDAARAFRDLAAQVRLGPRPAGSAGARREVAFISRRLRAAGIADVAVQRPHRNVVARIPGDEPGTVVVGAHYDTKRIPGFVGANDGASGVAVLLELARDLPARLRGPSIDLVFFDAEESPPGEPFERGGDRGSDQFVGYARRGGAHGSPPLRGLRAMVLFDMVGDCRLSVPREANSDPALYARFARAASESGTSAPFEAKSAGVIDDHAPFIRAGVPAVDLIDFDYGPGPAPGAWWHTRQDDLRHVCARSLGAVGGPALVALPGIR